MQIKTVGVLGCGLMGAGIAQVSAAAGYKTIVREVEQGFLTKGLGRIEKFLAGGDEKGASYAVLDSVLADHAIVCSNTSSLCITELASKTRRPDRFGGLHFFNPVPLMKLVEVIRALTTSDETNQTLTA